MLSQKTLEIILNFEQDSNLVNSKQLFKTIDLSINNGKISFILFPCLATEKNQELTIDFFKTSFFNGGKKELSKSVSRAETIIKQICSMGLEAEIIACLSDTEPTKVWGWNIDQDEITVACQLMVEQAKEVLSPIWQPMLWSDIEAKYQGPSNFESILADLNQTGKHRLLIDAQEKHLLSTRHDYHFLPPREVAKRRVASYGLEGLVMEQVLPNTIFMQIANPYKIRDPLHQRLRTRGNELPIVHLFRQR